MKIRTLALAGATMAALSGVTLAEAASPLAAKTLVVFFDFNQARLTNEGEKVVSDAVRAVNDDGYGQITLTGHCDRVGTEPYNDELSARRAEVVRDALVREGVLGSLISFEGRGARNPLVQTGRGVREPQNRRVVIDLGS